MPPLSSAPLPMTDFQSKGEKKNEKGIVTLLLQILITNADFGFVLWIMFSF